MSGRDNWGASVYSASAKEKSLAETEEKFAAMRREEEERARYCQCDKPIPGYPKMGQRPCVVCRRFIR